MTTVRLDDLGKTATLNNKSQKKIPGESGVLQRVGMYQVGYIYLAFC